LFSAAASENQDATVYRTRARARWSSYSRSQVLLSYGITILKQSFHGFHLNIICVMLVILLCRMSFLRSKRVWERGTSEVSPGNQFS